MTRRERDHALAGGSCHNNSGLLRQSRPRSTFWINDRAEIGGKAVARGEILLAASAVNAITRSYRPTPLSEGIARGST
jgi:hypothetical protein